MIAILLIAKQRAEEVAFFVQIADLLFIELHLPAANPLIVVVDFSTSTQMMIIILLLRVVLLKSVQDIQILVTSR